MPVVVCSRTKGPCFEDSTMRKPKPTKPAAQKKEPAARKMTKADGKAWLKRWRLVNQYEIEELRRTTPEQVIEQLESLNEFAESLGWLSDEEREVDAVRQLWARIK